MYGSDILESKWNNNALIYKKLKLKRKRKGRGEGGIHFDEKSNKKNTKI